MDRPLSFRLTLTPLQVEEYPLFRLWERLRQLTVFFFVIAHLGTGEIAGRTFENAF